jgi:hypothetical protein
MLVSCLIISFNYRNNVALNPVDSLHSSSDVIGTFARRLLKWLQYHVRTLVPIRFALEFMAWRGSREGSSAHFPNTQGNREKFSLIDAPGIKCRGEAFSGT